MLSRASLLAGIAVLWGLATASAQDSGDGKEPQERLEFLSPEEALRKMTFPDGFEVGFFAAEPDIVQPFAFTFDGRGRIWLAENLNYETRGSDTYGQGPKGRILILEDADGDGRMDRKKVFIDRLFFPSGLALGFGGVWVGSPPNLLFIPDRDGDDQPDGEPRVVLDGWGRDDRHETLNSFTWGPDGWLYGCHGVFTHSRVGKPGTPDAERVPINAGVWRYHPVKEAFEVFAWGTSNPWGLDFNEHGQMFITACVIPHLWHIIQGGRFHRQAGGHFNPHVYDDIKTIADHRHLSAHGGARFYSADAFPAAYRDRLFMCNIHQHAVLTDIIERKGSGYVGRHGNDFLLSNDVQWLGFNMEVGPEGAVYIIDWHDADICGRKVVHGETGRIWRISYRGTEPARGLDLGKLSDERLIALHSHSNEWYVRQARRLLHERSAAGGLAATTHAKLRELLETADPVPQKLRALWSLHVTGGLREDLARRLLAHEDEYVRAWTVQLLAEDGRPAREALGVFQEMARSDPSPVVRLYLASVLQRLPIEHRWDIAEGLVSHAEDAGDHNLPLMYWYGIEPAVVADRKRALALATRAQISVLRRSIARRLAAAASAPRSSGGDTPVVAEPVRVEPAASVPADGLVLWLRADAAVHDGSGAVSRWTDGLRQDRHAAQPSSSARPSRVADLEGREAIRFDGTDDHLVVPHAGDIAFREDQSFSLCASVHVEDPRRGWQTVLGKSRDEAPWYGLWIDPAERWVYGATERNLAALRAARGWHHVAIVQEGGKRRRIYVDGALAGEAEPVHAHGGGDLWIGGAAGVREFFRGALSEVRLYRRALSHPEVAFLVAERE